MKKGFNENMKRIGLIQTDKIEALKVPIKTPPKDTGKKPPKNTGNKQPKNAGSNPPAAKPADGDTPPADPKDKNE